MPMLTETVERTWSRWDTEPEVERAVFGTDDAGRVAAAYERFAAEVLGSPVDGALFYEVTVTCVAGLVLADGRRVCVRAYQPNRPATFLQQATGVQSHLFAAGFPVPEPLLGPVAFEHRLHTVEAVVDDPGPPDGHDPAVRDVAVAGLLRCVDLLRPLAPTWQARHPQRPAEGALYPTPHSPLFRFDRPLPDVDDLARRATEVRDAARSPLVLGHLDWTPRNVRVVDGRLHVAYDWDSVDLVPRHQLAGQVAMTFTEAPSPDEVGDLVARFGVDERGARGAALWLACYVARCEHALDPAGGPWLSALRRWGDAYLGSPA